MQRSHLLVLLQGHCPMIFTLGTEILEDLLAPNGKVVFFISKWTSLKIIQFHHQILLFTQVFHTQMFLELNFVLTCLNKQRIVFTKVGSQLILLRLFWSNCNHFCLKPYQKISKKQKALLFQMQSSKQTISNVQFVIIEDHYHATHLLLKMKITSKILLWWKHPKNFLKKNWFAFRQKLH